MQTRNKAADNIVMSQISPRKLDIKETPSDATLRDQTLEPAHSKKNLGSLGYQESHRPQRGKAQFLEPQRWTALEINTLVENDKNLSTWQNSSRYEDTTHSSSRTSFKSGSESHNKPRNESRIYGAPEWLNGFSPLDDDDGESHNSATPSCLGHSHTGGRMIRLHEPISASPDTSTTELPASSISEDAEDIGDLEKFWPRTLWLILLLIIQSLVSIILQHYQGMIQHHPVVVYFLTMLIGSGGNAGSQSTVLVIRGLAVGKYKRKDYVNVIFEQCRTGLALAAILTAVSFIRMIFFEGDLFEVLAVCISMFAIIVTSVFTGAALPIIFKMFRIDPAHAGAAIQVAMDMVGVTLTCLISHIVLDRVAPAIDPAYLSRHAVDETVTKTTL